MRVRQHPVASPPLPSLLPVRMCVWSHGHNIKIAIFTLNVQYHGLK